MSNFRLDRPDLLRQDCFVDGRWIKAESGLRHYVINPASGETVASVPHCAAVETRAAIIAADRALPSWKDSVAAERSAILRRWFDLMLKHREDLARIMTAEQGKPLAEARGEIGYAASFIEWYAEEAKRAYGEVIPSPIPDRRLVVFREAIGVCAAITPWNFPSAMITRKAAAALAAGCTIVVKPALQTPLSAFALAVLAEEAGIPPGVFNVLSGDAESIGGELTTNPLVRKLSFTGSTAVGRRLMTQCAPTLKRLSLELGGNAPFIVFDDADVDAAVAGAVASRFRNAGQTCICANRFLVQAGVHDEFVRKLGVAVQALRVGNGTESGIDQGPLIDERALHKVEFLVSEAVSSGARILCGGNRHSLGRTYFEPTVLADVAPSMRIAREEIFGPVAAVIRFKDEPEGVRLANDTEYGLAAYFFSRDIGRVQRISGALDFGMVGINTGSISTEVAPFGGVKQSGFGREGARQGLDEYLNTKYLSLAGR